MSHGETSPGDSLDRELKSFAEQARQYPQGSRHRNKLTSRLIMMIEESGKLYCPEKSSYPVEVYHEALQEVRLYIFRSIDRYDPTRAKMMTWVNRKLSFAFQDAARKYRNRHLKTTSLSIKIARHNEGSRRTLEDIISSETSPFLSEKLREVIKQDLSGEFRNKHLKGRPEINFQSIALKMIDGYSRREIADHWQVKEQRLYSFFSRCCKLFRPLIDKQMKT